MKRTLVAALALPSFATLALPPQVEAIPLLSAGSATVTVGDTFTIPISVSGATDLQAFQFDLSYNSAVLLVLGFTDVGTDFETAATAGGGVLTGITGFSFSGLLDDVADSMSGVPPGGGLTDGILVNVQFQALAAGDSSLELSEVIVNFIDSSFDVAAGQVTTVPAPGTLALLALGLGLLTGRRWWTSMR